MDTPVAEHAAQSPNPAPTTTAPASAPAATAAAATSPTTKPVHSLVIDANVIIKNDPSVSTLIAQAEELYTIPSVVSESMFTPLYPHRNAPRPRHIHTDMCILCSPR